MMPTILAQMMPTILAQRLATHAVWPVAVQHLLAAMPAIQKTVMSNQCLDPDMVAALAATCTTDDLPWLIQNQRTGVDGLRACLHRAAEIYRGAQVWDELDFEVAWSLLCANDPQRVRDLDADIARVPTSHSTAARRYAAGVDLPKVELVAGFDRSERARWLTSPHAVDVSDDDAWRLLMPASSGIAESDNRSVRPALVAALLHRPRLRAHGIRPDSDHLC